MQCFNVALNMWCLFGLKCHLGKEKEKLSELRQCWLNHIFYLEIIYFQRPVLQLTICTLPGPVLWLYLHANRAMKGRCGFLCNPEWTLRRKLALLALLTTLTWGFQRHKESSLQADTSPYRADRSIILINLPPQQNTSWKQRSLSTGRY